MGILSRLTWVHTSVGYGLGRSSKKREDTTRITSASMMNRYHRRQERSQEYEQRTDYDDHWDCPFFQYCWERRIRLPSRKDCPEPRRVAGTQPTLTPQETKNATEETSATSPCTIGWARGKKNTTTKSSGSTVEDEEQHQPMKPEQWCLTEYRADWSDDEAQEATAQLVLPPQQVVFEKPAEKDHRKLGKTPEDLVKTNMVLKDFGGNSSEAKGCLNVELTVKSKTLATTFFVIDGKGSYTLLLGRDWIHANCGILSTMHQNLIQWHGDQVEVIAADRSVNVSTTDLPTWESEGYECISRKPWSGEFLCVSDTGIQPIVLGTVFIVLVLYALLWAKRKELKAGAATAAAQTKEQRDGEILNTEKLQGYSELHNCGLAHLKSSAIRCAVGLGIPSAIYHRGGMATISDVITETGLHTAKLPYLRRLMRALTVFGIFGESSTTSSRAGESQTLYTLSPASRLLVQEEGDSTSCDMSALLLLFTRPHTTVSTFFNLEAWFRDPAAGTTFEMAHGMSPWSLTEIDASYNDAMNHACVADSNLVMDVALKEARSIFHKLNSLIDVGGGHGAAAVAIARVFSHITCSV
uniref:O-methyltransferase domain-containing protein n=1 Tax=Oryza brachyantha TaxID=4533 RepID=J3L832_ORYBR